MTSQEHVVSAVAMGIGLLAFAPADAAICAAGTSLFTGIGYLVFAWGVAGVRSMPGLVTWLVSYAPVQATSYMSFDARHFTRSVLSFFATIIPSGRGLGLRRLLNGSLDPSKILPQLSLLAILGLALLLAVGAIRNRGQIWRRHGRLALVATLWFGLCALFTVWSDPFGPERWLVAIIPLAYLVAIVLDTFYVAAGAWQTVAHQLSMGAVLVLFLANLTAAIWPDHHSGNPLLDQAVCSSQRMTGRDIIISPAWDFTRYLDSVAPHLDYVQLIHLSAIEVGRTPDRMRFRSVVDGLVDRAHAGGGRAYLVDVFGYDAGEWEMVEWNTGLIPADFERYHRRLAWACEGAKVWEIELAGDQTQGLSPAQKLREGIGEQETD
jgi:hypothetical protein